MQGGKTETNDREGMGENKGWDLEESRKERERTTEELRGGEDKRRQFKGKRIERERVRNRMEGR